MSENVIRLSVYALLSYLFISCNSGEAKQPGIDASKSDQPATELEAVMAALPPRVDSVYESFPADTVFAANILLTGQFHADEVDSADALRNWYGIFRNNEGYYLDSTHIIATRVEDILGEEEGQKTGWLLKTTNSDTSFLLIAGVEGLSKHKITSVTIAKPEMLPGTSSTFSYNGITYTLSATGNSGPNGDNYAATSYRLVLKAVIKGVERQQLLVAHPGLGDTVIMVLFAGDLDGDGFPDLIIDTINHYNGSRPTLYLSKPARGNDLLKIMGWHVSVGC